jgi:uncharacterized phiE125 gp8 family phage protein
MVEELEGRMIVWPAKASAEIEDFEFDFSELLEGDEELTSPPSLTPTGVTINGTPTAEDGKVKLWLSAGIDGTVAKVACTVPTNLGRTYTELAVLEIGAEVISLAAAKSALKIESDHEDPVLGGFLRASIGHIERATGKKLRPKIVTQTIDGFPRRLMDGRFPLTPLPVWLLYGPASEILSIEYDDRNGVTQTLSSFRLIPGRPSKLLPAYGECWPCAHHGEGTVRLTYVAGYDPTELPWELLQAVIMLFGHFNANREAVIASERAAAVELPLGVSSLISDFCFP